MIATSTLFILALLSGVFAVGVVWAARAASGGLLRRACAGLSALTLALAGGTASALPGPVVFDEEPARHASGDGATVAQSMRDLIEGTADLHRQYSDKGRPLTPEEEEEFARQSQDLDEQMERFMEWEEQKRRNAQAWDELRHRRYVEWVRNCPPGQYVGEPPTREYCPLTSPYRDQE